MAENHEDALEYGRCTECGYLTLPVPQLSPCGHAAAVTTKPLTEPGEVYSWTRLRLGETDRLMVMVDFFGGDLRVTAPLVGAESVSIGDWVRLIPSTENPYVFEPDEGR